MRRILAGLILVLAASSAAQSGDDSASQCQSDDPDLSIQGCTALIQSGPTGVQAAARYNRGIAYSHKGLLDAAIADFIAAVRADPVYAEAYNELGIAYKNKGRIDQAIENYTSAIALKPAFVLAYNNRARAYLLKGEYEKGLSDADKAVALSPSANNVEIQAELREKIGQADPSVVEFTEAIARNPNDAEAYYNRGFAYKRLRLYDRAIADLTKSTALRPNYSATYHERGDVYVAMRLYDQAIADYTTAIALEPNADIYVSRGIAYDEKRQVDRAIADYTRALAQKPYFKPWVIRAYVRRAGAYAGKDGRDASAKAIADYTKVIALEPRYIGAFENRARLYEGLGQRAKAIADWKAALKLEPGDAQAKEALERLAAPQMSPWDQCQNAKADAAIEACTAVIKSGEHLSVAYMDRAVAYVGKRLYDQAIADYTAALALTADNDKSDFYAMRAMAYHQKGDDAEALLDAERAMALFSSMTSPRGWWDAAIVEIRAQIYESLGQRQKAAADYRQALKINPNSKDARDGLNRLGAKP